jgi:ferrous iron transport protein B
VAQLLWEKAKDFLQRAFTIILLATIVIWFLQSFDLRLNLVADAGDSILALVAGLISPIFAPLGFGDWRCATALITGFLAKESVVSTLTILYGSTTVFSQTMSSAAAAALLVFCLLYTPCVAAIASIKQEMGTRRALVTALFQCVVAWVCALIVHGIGLMIL